MRRPALLLSALLLMLAAAQASIAASIKDVRIWPAPDHTRIVFDVDGAISHKMFVLENPARLVIDLKNTDARIDLAKVEPSGELIKKVRYAKRNGTDLRVVFDLSTLVKPKSFVLEPNQQYGDRLVVDLFTGESSSQTQITKQATDGKRDIIIAIDAGHGGEDPGALGVGGVAEKDVVLEIAKELNWLFQEEVGFKPVMIRDGDYFVGLERRPQNARANNADFFVSVHANWFKSASVSGAMVFAVSKKGATSETAKWLAERENRADLIGGVGSVSLGDKDQMLAGVLLDLSMSASMRASMRSGALVLEEIGKVTKVHTKRVEQGGLVVLKSPDIPSILVETGYITNPSEAKKLNHKNHQRALARAMFNGIKQYFNENPPPGTYVAWMRKNSPEPREYRITRGDTLSEIAVRNNVSELEIKRINGLTSDTIRIGQVIQIPSI